MTTAQQVYDQVAATTRTKAPEVQRDRFGRPLIIPPSGGKPVAYTRATTVAGTLDDLYGLMGWKQRQTALGLADRPDLQLAVTSHRDNKRELDRICEQAMEAAGSSTAATTGTALHSLTEIVDRGQDLPTVPAAHQADLDAYRQVTAPLRMLAIEQQVVLDDLKVHGTADRIAVLPDGRTVIADIKSGKLDYAGPKIAAQLALYAHGIGYQPATGERFDLPPVDQTVALVIHLPAGEGQCTLYEVDIAAGWETIPHALYARQWRKRRNLITATTIEAAPVEQQIAAASTVEQLTRIYHTHRHVWTDAHTTLARSVKESLQAAA